MSTNQEVTNTAAAAEISSPSPALTPEAIVDGLRAMRAQIGEVTQLSPQQRVAVRNRAKTSNPILQASINVIGALDNVAQALGQPAVNVRQLHEEADRWTAVEDELRAMLSGVSGANLIRREQVRLVAAQAVTIGTQLARNPANGVLLPHLQEIRRLKSFNRRKKAAPVPDPTTPSAPQPPAPPTSPQL